MPLFFGLKFTDTGLLVKTFIAFASFSFVASAIYVFNDYCDVEQDRNHPKKRARPLASGSISKRSAIWLMIVSLVVGVGIATVLSKTVVYLILAYFVLNIAYTLKLKHIAIVDVFIISIGFILRLIVGAETGGVQLSMWIILITFLLAMFLALAKRRDDLIIYLESGYKGRGVIDGYNTEFLNASMIVMVSVVIVSYIMYTVSLDVVAKMHSDKLYMTVIFVVLGLMRYMQLTFVEKKSGSPTEVLLRDRFLQLSILGWLLAFVLIIY